MYVIDTRQVLIYHDRLDEEDTRHQGKEKRVYPKQNLAAAESKQTHSYSYGVTLK